MKTKKLLSKLSDLMATADAEDKKHLKNLCKVVKKLKAKQKGLEKDLADAEGKEARRRLRHKIDVIRAQRKKAIDFYYALKEKRGPVVDKP